MSRQTWVVSTPVESKKEGGKTFWARVGAAWQRDDGGFTVELNSLPVNGKLLISPPRDDGEKAPF